MIEFEVQALSCGHCVRAVTEAVQEVDPSAKVDVDLDRKKVSVQSDADRAALARALADAGYPPR
jgi:copper chaperone